MKRSSTPTIDRFRVRAIRLPMRDPHQTASGTVAESPLVLTDVVHRRRRRSGTASSSRTRPRRSAPTAELVRSLEALLKGDALAPADIEQKLARRVPPARHAGPRRHGARGDRHGAVGRARARFTACRWSSFSAAPPGPCPPTARSATTATPESARVAEDWAKRGFKGVKAKIGYPTVAEDVAVIRAMRMAVGPDVAIMVDYNQCLTPAEAVRAHARARRRGPDLGRGADARRTTTPGTHGSRARPGTPIQCGENWWGALDLQHAIDAHASDYVMPDVMKIGGVTGWQRAAAHRRDARPARVEPSVARDQRPAAGRHADRTLARVRGLVERHRARTARDPRRHDRRRRRVGLRRGLERGGDRPARRLSEQRATVFVTGGTGYIGRPLIETLLARGHAVHALARAGSQDRAPAGATIAVGRPLDAATFAYAIPPSATIVHLVGTPHPNPSKAAEFERVDLASIRATARPRRRPAPPTSST